MEKPQNERRGSSAYRIWRRTWEAQFIIVMAVVGVQLLLLVQPDNHGRRMGFVDAVFMSFSAVTGSGLASVFMSHMTVFQLTVLMLLSLFGSRVFTTFLDALLKCKRDNRTEVSVSSDTQRLKVRAYKSEGDVLANVRIHGGVISVQCLSEEHQKDCETKDAYAVTWIIGGYWVGVQAMGFLTAWACIATSESSMAALRKRGSGPTFFAAFMTISHFSNTGLSSIDDGMMPFAGNLPLLIVFASQMLLGNTCFPAGFRVFVWACRRWSPKRIMAHSSFLYPAPITVWFGAVTAACIAIQVASSLVLMWDNPVVAVNIDDGHYYAAGTRVVAAVFQAVAARHTGVNVWNLGLVSPTILFVYVIAMYVPPHPFLDAGGAKGAMWNAWEEMKRAVSQYWAFLASATLLICLIEHRNIEEDHFNYSILNLVFEVVSAGMNVGLSVGYSCGLRTEAASHMNCKDVPYSFSGKWSHLSKIVLVGAMMAGRLRPATRGVS